MKRLAAALALCASLAAGCRSETPLGQCVGFGDESLRDQSLVYEVSTRNVILAVIFFETAIVPIWVALEETYCPVAKKPVRP